MRGGTSLVSSPRSISQADMWANVRVKRCQRAVSSSVGTMISPDTARFNPVEERIHRSPSLPWLLGGSHQRSRAIVPALKQVEIRAPVEPVRRRPPTIDSTQNARTYGPVCRGFGSEASPRRNRSDDCRVRSVLHSPGVPTCSRWHCGVGVRCGRPVPPDRTVR